MAKRKAKPKEKKKDAVESVELQTKDFTESEQYYFFEGARPDRENSIVRGVSIIKPTTINRDYTEEALQKAIPMYEGAKVMFDHQLDKKERSVRALGGMIENVRWEDDRVRGDFHVLPTEAVQEFVFAIAESMPKVCAFSHNVSGKYRITNGRELVEEITKVRSVDLVTDPSANQGLFESVSTKEEEEEAMTDLTIEAVKGDAAIMESLKKEFQAENDSGAEMQTLKDKNKELQESVDAQKIKDDAAVKRTAITKLMDDEKLVEERRTDELYTMLEKLDDGEQLIIIKREAGVEETKIESDPSKANTIVESAGKKIDVTPVQFAGIVQGR